MKLPPLLTAEEAKRSPRRARVVAFAHTIERLKGDQQVIALNGELYLSQLLGVGGRGLVYKAISTETGAKLAVKLCPSNPEDIQTLLDEARVTQAISTPPSPYLVEYATQGFAQFNGLSEQPYFLATRLINGCDLADIREGQPLPLDLTMLIALHICKGLGVALEKGYIHRDLAPHNVRFDRETRTFRVYDFGETLRPKKVGTPGWGSITMYERIPEPTEVAGDMFALGNIIRTLLLGYNPIEDTPPRQLGTMDHTKPCPSNHPSVNQLIFQMLGKHADRPTSYQEVEKQIEAIRTELGLLQAQAATLLQYVDISALPSV